MKVCCCTNTQCVIIDICLIVSDVGAENKKIAGWYEALGNDISYLPLSMKKEDNKKIAVAPL